ncbi:MAG: hypothetical protein NWE88_13425 [Candidatus Bathyarchaeota archaeon]|nr:hypothetical protein [Candidatus Bathyarchaeota archaeon]
MELENYKAGTPEEEFEKALVALAPTTRSRYRGYFKAFCEEMNTTPQKLYDFALSTYRSEKTAERLAMKKAWIGFYDSLLAKGVHPNYAAGYRKALNKFLEANGLPKVIGGVKTVQYKGQSRIKPDEVRRVLALPMSERLRALILVLDQSGIRCSDVELLTIEEFKLARTGYMNDKEFRTWRKPMTSQKTGVNIPVCLGPEAIEAIKNYIKTREGGPIFLREKGMFHWTTDDNGDRVKTTGRTEKGSRMDRHNISMSIWSLVKPLREEGLRVSAHSFRKRFLDGWDQARMLNTGKYIAGKKIPNNDSAYLDIEDRYFEAYMTHYFEYISLEKRDTELENLQNRIKELDAQLKIERRNKIETDIDVRDLAERVRKMEPAFDKAKKFIEYERERELERLRATEKESEDASAKGG